MRAIGRVSTSLFIFVFFFRIIFEKYVGTVLMKLSKISGPDKALVVKIVRRFDFLIVDLALTKKKS